jgi:hypothetical protein
MILLFFFLFLVAFGGIWATNKMYKNRMLNPKQRTFYILLLVIFILFLVGQMDKTNL